MSNTVSMNHSNIKLDSYVKDFLNPKYVFLPIEKGSKLRVRDNVYVYKNDIVMLTKEGMSVHSSISGRVLGVKDVLYVNGEKVSSLVIENDFKENMRIRRSARKFIHDYKKENFLNLLEDTSLYHNGYTYKKFLNHSDTFIVNGVELEPFFGNKYFLLRDNIEEILETIDLISEMFSYKKCVLAIKNNDSEIVNGFMDTIGTYPNIELRLVNDEYPIGLDEYLESELGYKDAFLMGVDELVDIYTILKKEIPISEKLITITGDAITPRCTIRVKIGSLLSEVFIGNFDFTTKCVDVYLNGIMRGTKVDTLQYVIDENLDGIVVMAKEEKTPKDCINCGLCHKNCPKGLNPKYVFDHKGMVKEEYKNTCLQCGLCNYVCPSNRDLKKYMKEVCDEKE